MHLESDSFNRLQEKDLGRDTPLVAARARHVAGTECREVTWTDAGLRIVIEAWQGLSERERREILAIVTSATTESGSES